MPTPASVVIPGLEKATKFVDPRAELPRIIWSIQGETKTMKSTFGLSGPGPVVVFDIDDRLEGVANPWMDGTRGFPPKVIKRMPLRLPKIQFNIKVSDPAVAAWQREAKLTWDFYLEHYYMALESSLKDGGVRTIVMDDATSIVDLRLISEFGRLAKIPPTARGDANIEIGALMREGHKYRANVVWIHELKDEYKLVKVPDRDTGEMKESSEKTGKRILDGYKKADYAVQVLLETSIHPVTRKFQIKVLSSGLNAKTNGKVYTEDDWGEEFTPLAFLSSTQLPRKTPYDFMDED